MELKKKNFEKFIDTKNSKTLLIEIQMTYTQQDKVELSSCIEFVLKKFIRICFNLKTLNVRHE